MKKAAVVIGVDKTGDMTVLRAAATGAKDFAFWARNNEFEVELITDIARPVTLADIKKAVRKFVDARTYDQLIIHFSGHGLLRGDYELWLLSGSPDDSGEAVNMPLSISYARNAGISHVIFISDACRSIPNTVRLNAVTGGEIFPVRKPTVQRPQVDTFYATLLGEPAYEASPKEIADNYRALFTECMLRALTGGVADAIEPRNEPPPPCGVVSAWTLKQYLERVVPEEAEAISIKVKQNPDIRVESRLPNCLAEFPNTRISAFRPREHIIEPAPEPTNVFSAIDDGPGPAPKELDRPGVTDGVVLLLRAKGRESFETGVGFTVVGAKVSRAVATGPELQVFEENAASQIRVVYDTTRHHPASALIQFDSGNGAVLAILPGLIGTVVVDHARVVGVSYIPSRYSSRYIDYEYNADAIKKRHALVGAAARYGAFRIDPSTAAETAEYLRRLKFYDPTLGIYATYAYAQIGAREDAESVYEHMAMEPEPIPFDVALLADKLPRKGMLVGMKRVAPFCPMLSQGWALLGPAEIRLAASVRAARQYLVPALWTTFGPEAVSHLWDSIRGGILK